jgi:hypothetical protein
LKNKLTGEGLNDTLARTITSWLDTGKVDVDKYDRQYHDAINSQNSIGWMNLFSGRISQKRLELYEQTMVEPRTEEEQKYFKHYNGYIWGTAVVEKILRTHVELWETRNKEIHEKDEESSTQRHKRLQEKVRNLHTMENKVKP